MQDIYNEWCFKLLFQQQHWMGIDIQGSLGLATCAYRSAMQKKKGILQILIFTNYIIILYSYYMWKIEEGKAGHLLLWNISIYSQTMHSLNFFFECL